VACLALLLVATSAEAAHFCELAGSLGHAQVVAGHATGSAPAFCLICVTAHSPSLAAPLISFTPGVGIAGRAFAQPVQPWSRLQVFALYIRPPPAA